jgi:hypothetical protein
MNRPPAPLKGYAIQQLNDRGQSWLLPGSFRVLRRDALASLLPPNSTETWRAEVQRRRRNGQFTAVRVVLMTEDAHRDLIGTPRRVYQRDRRTLDLFANVST